MYYISEVIKLISIKGISHDPYFNLASEEYMLKETDEDVFMLWQNEKSVIIGKNQNAWAEINSDFVEKNGIKVARRMTGGGAVFHDLGNINYTYITSETEENRLNFAYFSQPIIKALKNMGIEACLDGRNDLVVEGFKISGSAECVSENRFGTSRILHHGTLLFSADLSDLAGALTVNHMKLESKGIKSVRSRVANLSQIDGYCGPVDIEDFISALFCEISPFGVRTFTDEENDGIRELRKLKYSSYDWIWGKSPVFDVRNEMRFTYGTLCADVRCEKGAVVCVNITGDYLGSLDISFVEKALKGVLYNRKSVKEVLSSISEELERCISGSCSDDLASLIVPDDNMSN